MSGPSGRCFAVMASTPAPSASGGSPATPSPTNRPGIARPEQHIRVERPGELVGTAYFYVDRHRSSYAWAELVVEKTPFGETRIPRHFSRASSEATRLGPMPRCAIENPRSAARSSSAAGWASAAGDARAGAASRGRDGRPGASSGRKSSGVTRAIDHMIRRAGPRRVGL
jgi:hypothetical protein